MSNSPGTFFIHVKSKRRYFALTQLAYHTELNENLVIYFDDEGNCWARPEPMFMEETRFVVDPDQSPWLEDSQNGCIQPETTQETD